MTVAQESGGNRESVRSREAEREAKSSTAVLFKTSDPSQEGLRRDTDPLPENELRFGPPVVRGEDRLCELAVFPSN